MRSVGFWVSAASALALAACGQARKTDGHLPAKAAAAATTTAAAVQQPAAPAPGEAEAVGSSVPGLAAGRPPTAHAAVEARIARPGARRERSVEPDEDTEALAADRPAGSPEAREHTYSAAYRACMASAHGYTAVLADCYNAELVRQGERLNRAFDSAVAARSGERRKRLQLAQHAWSQQLDSACQDGNGPDLLHEGSCRLDLTIKRANELEDRPG